MTTIFSHTQFYIMRQLVITLLFISLLISSCKKDDLNYNYYSLAETPAVENENLDNNFSNPFHQQIIETNIAFFHLLITIAKESIQVPELYLLQDNQAYTRTGCPDFIFSPVPATGMPITYPNTVTMDFDDGSGNCRQGNGGGSTSDILYDGSITVIFNSPIGSTNLANSNPEIQVTGINNLMINGYTFSAPAGATVDLNLAAGLAYNFALNGGDITSTKGGTTTKILNGANGSFTLGADGGVTDDPNDPSTYADNAFNVALNQAGIACTNNTGTFNFCTDTSPNQSIELKPQTCSCPTQGTLRIESGACMVGIPTSENSTLMDFGFNNGSTDGGECNDDVFEINFIELISWEGGLTAGSGEAGGETSLPINVLQNNSNTVTESLQLKDPSTAGATGSLAHGFKWAAPSTNSRGMINANQTIANTTSTSLPWINEIHYTDGEPGSDTNEGFEIAGPADFNLSNYFLRLYNGTSPATNAAIPLGSPVDLSAFGRIPNEGGTGYGAIWFPKSGIQNGNNDGVALIKRIKANLNFCK